MKMSLKWLLKVRKTSSEVNLKIQNKKSLKNKRNIGSLSSLELVIVWNLNKYKIITL